MPDFEKDVRSDPHGQVTFKGTPVFVADVLADVEAGLSWDFIVQRWGSGKISKGGDRGSRAAGPPLGSNLFA